MPIFFLHTIYIYNFKVVFPYTRHIYNFNCFFLDDAWKLENQLINGMNCFRNIYIYIYIYIVVHEMVLKSSWSNREKARLFFFFLFYLF